MKLQGYLIILLVGVIVAVQSDSNKNDLTKTDVSQDLDKIGNCIKGTKTGTFIEKYHKFISHFLPQPLKTTIMSGEKGFIDIGIELFVNLAKWIKKFEALVKNLPFFKKL